MFFLSLCFSGTNTYIKAVFDLCYLVNLRFRVFPYHSNTIFYFTPHGYSYRKACKIAHDHTGMITIVYMNISSCFYYQQNSKKQKKWLVTKVICFSFNSRWSYKEEERSFTSGKRTNQCWKEEIFRLSRYTFVCSSMFPLILI